MKIKTAMRNLIKKSGMQQDEIASKMGISESNLSQKINDDKRPLWYSLEKIVKAAGYQMKDLVAEYDKLGEGDE